MDLGGLVALLGLFAALVVLQHLAQRRARGVPQRPGWRGWSSMGLLMIVTFLPATTFARNGLAMWQADVSAFGLVLATVLIAVDIFWIWFVADAVWWAYRQPRLEAELPDDAG